MVSYQVLRVARFAPRIWGRDSEPRQGAQFGEQPKCERLLVASVSSRPHWDVRYEYRYSGRLPRVLIGRHNLGRENGTSGWI